MPTEAVLHQLSSRKVTESLTMQIILHCAPVLKKVKMSSMFTVPAAYLRFVRSLFQGTQIKVKCLCQGAGRAVVYVYRESEVQQCLKDPAVIAFLQKFGYRCRDGKKYLDVEKWIDAEQDPDSEEHIDVEKGMNTEECLAYLSQRVSLSAQGMESYPHEMGIFLGYPLEDVREFMLRGGKDSLYTGYWKVYADVEQAKETFRTYDTAKESAVMEYMAGKTIQQIAC